MTNPITFTDSNGVDCTLRVERTRECGELGDFSTRTLDLATESDLRAAAESQGYALVRLATGSNGPTDEELLAIEEAAPHPEEYGCDCNACPGRRALFDAGRAAEAAKRDARERELETEGGPTTRELEELRNDPLCEEDGLRNIYFAGAASRQAEVDRLMAGIEGLTARLTTVESELAATKSKLAEVERELDAMRRVVEAVKATLEKGPRYTDRHLEAAADAVVDEIREAMALASATSSQPAEAEARVEALIEASSLGTAWWRGHDSCAHEMSARLADALGVPPASWQELVAMVEGAVLCASAKPEPAEKEPAATVPIAEVEALEQVVSRLNAEPAASSVTGRARGEVRVPPDRINVQWWKGHVTVQTEPFAILDGAWAAYERVKDDLSKLPAWAGGKPEPAATVPIAEVEEIARRIEGKASLALYTEDRRAYLDALSLVRALVDCAKDGGA